MAKRSSSFRSPEWLKHQQLLTTEAVLLVAVGMELLQRWITSHHQVPWWVKTLEVMAVNAGMLGGALLILTAFARGSLSSAARAVQSSLPAPVLLIHVAVFAAIFVIYAKVWDFWPR